MWNKKGFTLIELLAVLVVLAILALISIPITIRIINSARENSYKRSIENYAKTFEKVIAIDSMSNASSDYKALTNYAQDVENMYTGNRVSCDLNKSSIVNGKLILRKCIVKNRNNNQISKYEYRYMDRKVIRDFDEYSISQRILLHDEYYYVIEDSGIDQDYVVLLKEDPLEYETVKKYVDDNCPEYWGISVSNTNGYGVMQYGTSPGYYENSYIKVIVDAWAQEIFPDELKSVSVYDYGEFKSRIISKEDLQNNLDCQEYTCQHSKYNWTYGNYNSATMSSIANTGGWQWLVYSDGRVNTLSPYQIDSVVRPVINVYKSAIESSD